jgi:tetratricopeptide (TPR) repeat protein
MSALMAVAWLQASHWINSQTLWTHTLAHTRDNCLAHNSLGTVFAEEGKLDEAIGHFRHALQLYPDYEEANNNLGNALREQGYLDDAITYLQHVLRLNPDSAAAHNNLGIAMAQQGNIETAIAHFQHALQINPDNAETHNNLNIANRVLTLNRQGSVLVSQGRFAEAIRCWEQALAVSPGYPEAKNNLARLLATAPDPALRDGRRAVELALAAIRFSEDVRAAYLDTLAAAYAEAGQFSEAVATARNALQAATGQEALAAGIRERLDLYQAGCPYHAPVKNPSDAER